MAEAPQDPCPYSMTANGRPVPGGFTGTVPAFLDWLEARLAYGGISIGEPEPDELHPGRSVREVRLVTAGYSDDEDLLCRVGRGTMFSLRFWESDHRGGLSIYRVPIEDFDSDKETTWLDEPTDVFEEIWRARRLIVDAGHSTPTAFDVPGGVRLRFAEPDRDVCAPAGVLTIEQLPVSESADLFSPSPETDAD